MKMYSRLMLAVDVDDVVADLLPAWLDRYNNDYDDNLTHNQITEWSLIPFVKPECGRKIYNYLDDPTLYQEVYPVEGAFEGIQKLRMYAHILRIIFATVRDVADAKFNWLRRYGFIETRDDFIVAHDKSIINYSLIIDDKPENILNPYKPGILFHRDHNKYFHNEFCGITWFRAMNWEDVVSLVERILL